MQCFLFINNQQRGPYSAAEVREFLAQGHIDQTTQVWPEGAAGWMPLEQIPGLIPAEGAAPRPVPAVPPGQPSGSNDAASPGPGVTTSNPVVVFATEQLPQLLLKLKVPLVLLALVGVVWWAMQDSPVHVGADPKPGRPAMILLHGYGAPPEDLVPLAEKLAALAPGVSFTVPGGPHRVGVSGRSWMERVRANSPEELEELVREQRSATRKIILEIVEDLRSDGVAPKDIVVGGFSQGAGVALDVVLSGGVGGDIGGLVFLSGRVEGLDLTLLSKRAPLRSFVSHGAQDAVLSIENAKQLVAALQKAGHPVTWVEFGGGHQIPKQVIEGAGKFLAERASE